MGIDTEALIVVGLPEAELEIDRDDYGGDWDEKGILEGVPPFYDADEHIVGVIVAKSPDYWYKEIDLKEIIQEVDAAKKLFKDITGMEGKVYLSPRVW